MGRGRAKAKQTKVARELKYSSGGFDPDALRAELVGSEGAPDAAPATGEADSDDTDTDDDLDADD
jgi:hypothetical protein